MLQTMVRTSCSAVFSFIKSPNLSTVSDAKSLNAKRINLFVCLIRHHTIKTSFLISAQNQNELSASCSGHFTPEKEPTYCMWVLSYSAFSHWHTEQKNVNINCTQDDENLQQRSTVDQDVTHCHYLNKSPIMTVHW